MSQGPEPGAAWSPPGSPPASPDDTDSREAARDGAWDGGDRPVPGGPDSQVPYGQVPYGQVPYGQVPQGGPAAPPGWGGAPAGWGGAPPGWGGPRPGAPRPGVVPLRPLGLGELLDGAVSVVRSYPRPTLGLSALVAVISTVLGVLLVLLLPETLFDAAGGGGGLQLSDGEIGGLVAGSVGAVVVSSLAGLVLSGVITAVVGRAVLGRPMTLGEAWVEVRPLLWRLLGLAMVTGLIVVGVVVVAAGLSALAFLGLGGAGAAVAVPLVLGALVLAGYLYVRLSLAPPVLVLEKAGVRKALRRSGVLVSRSFWRVLGVLVLAAVIAGFVAQVLQVPFQFLDGGASFLSPGDVSPRGLVLAQVGAGLASALTAPFSSGVRALLYIDRRMRAEGLDVTLAAAAAPRP